MSDPVACESRVPLLRWQPMELQGATYRVGQGVEQLREAREAAGYGVAWMAARAGISPEAIQAIEAGERMLPEYLWRHYLSLWEERSSDPLTRRRRIVAQVLTDLSLPLALRGKPTPLDGQVGGDHYQGLAIPPALIAWANNLGGLEAEVLNRLLRYKAKGGVEDLRKAAHGLEILISLELAEAGF